MVSFNERKQEKENEAGVAALLEASKGAVNTKEETGATAGKEIKIKNIKESWFSRALPFIYLFGGSLVILAEIFFNLGLTYVGASCGVWILAAIWILK